jgi:hypothetical protein
VYDLGAFQEVGPFEGIRGVVEMPIRVQLKAVFAPNGTAQMPPPPASPLRERDRQTFVRWLANPLLGERRPDHLPRARLVELAAEAGDLLVTLDVFDPDGDTVLGQVTAGVAQAAIRRSGRQTVRLTGQAGSETVMVTLCDGFECDRDRPLR